MIRNGHNQPSMDAVVEENLRRGHLLTIKDAAVTALRDVRLGVRHRRVLAEILDHVREGEEIAYPGRKRLAERCHLTEATTATVVSELIDYGYLISEKRQPKAGGPAVAHYAIMKPSIEELETYISAWVKQHAPRNSDERCTDNVKMPLNVKTHLTLRRASTLRPHNVDTPLNVKGPSKNGAHIATRATKENPSGLLPFLESEESEESKVTASCDANLKKVKRRSQIQPDWVPDEKLRLWVKSRYEASDWQIQQQGEQFREYHRGKGSLMADWAATWHTWWGNGYHKIPLKALAETKAMASPRHQTEEEVYQENIARAVANGLLTAEEAYGSGRRS
jgi:hypothetical protein